MERPEDKVEYPKEFDTKTFLQFIQERFGTPVLAEQELVDRFAKFIGPRETGSEVPRAEIEEWYRSVVNEVENRDRPLDIMGAGDLTNPHPDRKPSLEKRLMDQERAVSLASGLLKQQHAPKKSEDRKPRPPVMGEE